MLRLRLSAFLAAFVLVGSASSQTYTWTSQATGNWSNGANWLGGSPPPGGGSPTGTYVFQTTGSPTTTAIVATNDLGATQFNKLQFESYLTGGLTITSAGSTLQTAGAAVIEQAGLGNVTFGTTHGLTLNGGLAVTGATGGAAAFGLGNVTFADPISLGAHTLTIGNGAAGNAPTVNTRVVALNGQNTFAGGAVVLDGGNLSVGGTGTLNSGLGDAASTFTVTANGGSLQAGTAISSLATGTMQLDGSLDFVGTSAMTLTGTLLSGAGALNIRTNSSVSFTIQSNSIGYTGVVTTRNAAIPGQSATAVGTLVLNGTSGALTGVSTFNIVGGTGLTLSSNLTGSTVNNDRVSDTATISLRNGVFLLQGAVGAAVVNTETVGAINGAGYSTVTATPGTGTAFTALTAASLNRVERGTFLFRGTALGSAGTGNVGNILFTSAPTLTGGGGAAGSTNISILPYAIGDTSGTGTGTSFVTYDTFGIRPLVLATEYQLNSLAGTDRNVRITAATANAGAATVNSLLIGTGGQVTGAGTIAVTSGAVAVTGGTAPHISNGLQFGGAEGLIFNPTGATISGNITGTNGLTKSGTGVLTLSGNNTGLTGQLTINGGQITVADLNSLGGTGQIVVNGIGGSSSGTGITYSGATAANLNRNIAVNGGYFSVRSSNGTGPLTLSGNISGAGGIFVSTSADVILTGNNTYTGTTSVFGGNVRFSSDSALGNGGTFDIGATATSGVVLDGNWTTSRHINISFSSLVNTQSNNAVWNGVVTGSSALAKGGTGSLTFAAANTYSGALTVNSGGGSIVLGQNGTVMSASYTINNAGSLVLDNTVLPTNGPLAGNVTTNRVVDSSTITLASGGTLREIGNAGASVTERLGNVTVTGAGNTIQVESFGGLTTVLSLSNLNATGGSVLVRGTNLGAASGTVGRVFLTNFNGSAVSNGQFLGNVTAEDLNNLGVVESAVYDTTVGVRLTNAGDFLNGPAIQNAAPTNTPTTANFRVNPGVANPVPILDPGNTIQSLRFAPNGVANYGELLASTLNITSGSVFTEAGGSGASITTVGGGPLTLDAGATPWNFGINANLTLNAALAGTGGMSKNGLGTLTLNAAPTLTGTYNINTGTLALGTSIATGAANSAVGSTINLGANTLTVGGAAGSALSGVVTGAGNLVYNPTAVAILTLNGANTFGGGVTGDINARFRISNAAGFGTGTVDVSAQTASSSFSTPTIGYFFAANSSTTVANDFVLTSTAGIDQFFTPVTNLNQIVRMTGLISGGSLAGTNRFVWEETGSSHTNVLILDNAANSFRGIVRSNFGTIAITSDGALGDADNDFQLQANATAQQGTLRFDANNIVLNANRSIAVTGSGSINTNGNNATVAGVMSGTTSFTKIGAGTLTLSNGGNTHTGLVNVNVGTLLVNGNIAAHATNAVTVANGATLGGTGTINRSIVVQAGGTLAPGASIGTLTAGNTVTLNAGTFGGWDIELNAVPTNTVATAAGAPDVDILALVGPASNLNLVSSSATPLRITLTQFGGTFDAGQPVNYVIATADAGTNFLTNGGAFAFDPNAFFFDSTNFQASGYSLSVDGNRLILSFAPVPEPSTLALVGAAGVGVWFFRRKRKSA